METYRRKVKQFLQFVLKNAFDIEKTQRRGINRKTGKRPDPRVQVRIIDEKLHQLASEMLYVQQSNLRLLAKVDEINGLIIDVMAA